MTPVHLRLAPRPEMVGVARTFAAACVEAADAAHSRTSSGERIEDIRVAVSEIVTALVRPADDVSIHLDFDVGDTRFDITGSGHAVLDEVAESVVSTLVGWTVERSPSADDGEPSTWRVAGVGAATEP